jgi:hypothetical protein
MFFHLLTFFDLKNIHAAGIIDQSIFIIDCIFLTTSTSPPSILMYTHWTSTERKLSTKLIQPIFS